VTFAIRRTLAARDDLVDIWIAIAVHDVRAADRHLDRIEDAISKLGEFPRIGASRPELMPGARALVRSPYLVVYTVDDLLRQVDIVRVVDARRDLQVLFGS